MPQWDSVKFWRKMSVTQAIAVFGGLLVALSLIKTFVCSMPDANVVILCPILDAVIILCGAAFGALLGFDIHDSEKKKRQGSCQPE